MKEIDKQAVELREIIQSELAIEERSLINDSKFISEIEKQKTPESAPNSMFSCYTDNCRTKS